MAINFPNSPSVNDTHTVGSHTWIWNGTVWEISAANLSLDARVTVLETDITSKNAQVGTAYTLALSDAGKVVEMDNASANTVTVPPNSSVAFPVGAQIRVLQTGAGQTTLAAGAGVTVNSKNSHLKLSAQWGLATLIKRATDTWVVVGDLSA